MVNEAKRIRFEHAAARGIADVLLADVYQHTGCIVILTGVGCDQVGSSEFAFMTAASLAMQELVAEDWRSC
jgi:hypothetical protein